MFFVQVGGYLAMLVIGYSARAVIAREDAKALADLTHAYADLQNDLGKLKSAIVAKAAQVEKAL